MVFTGVVVVALGLVTGCTGEEHRESYSGNVEELEPFTSIDIDALSPDVEVVVGNEYSIEYKLHDREHIDVLEVRDDTLIFDTGYNYEFDVVYGNFYIKITVPQDVEFDDVDIKTVAGNVYTDIEGISNASFITTSGNVMVEDSVIPQLFAKSTSKDVEVSGIFENIDISTVSGRCEVVSDNVKGDIQTVSGDIVVRTNVTEISANSFGEVKFFGENKGYRYESSDSDLNMVSVSGKITVE